VVPPGRGLVRASLCSIQKTRFPRQKTFPGLRMGARIAGLALGLVLALASPAPGVALSDVAPSPAAESAILVDSVDGRVLWEKNSHERRAIASLTKIATALVVLENTPAGATVIASRNAEAVGESDPLVSEIGLIEGEQQTVEQLLHGLLLESANDAAIALAQHVAGSVPAFVELMQQRVQDLGAFDTHFRNPHGLDEPDHYSSAFDLMLVAREAMRNPVFREIVRTLRYEIPGYGDRLPRLVENRNRLLFTYPGSDGIKTGRTRAAGRTLVASAARDLESRITVILSSPNPEQDATQLLDYGFNGFRRTNVAQAGKSWGYLTFGDGSTLALVPDRDLSLLVSPDGATPEARYDQKTSRLLVSFSLGEQLEAAVTRSCLAQPCRQPRASSHNPVTVLWQLIAPLARPLSSVR